ncbi:hypothetical protein [Larkinella soli]|uniref:hypothetical protein n=1 Tax=Larkinella soli TaxID=1770527 RepID=UPI000FFB382A|nr:hypothetical protein [Larkinella soli]
MKAIRTWKYLTLLAVAGFWGCSSSRQTAQNTGEIDDLYGSSSDAVVYQNTKSDRNSGNDQTTERFGRRSTDRDLRNANPDYYNEEEARLFSNDEYYSDVTARKAQRGLSPDPGWDSRASYNDGFANGYNAGMMNNSWNRWGWNTPFYSGLSFGLGLGASPWGWNSWRSGFYDPFWGSYAYNPFYSPFNSPFNYYGGFYDYGYGGFYNPYYGGGWGRPVLVVNNPNIGAARAVNYGARTGGSRDRYNGDFVNTPRSYSNNNGGRRSGELNSTNNSARTGSDTYYSRPNNTNSGSYGAGRQNSRGSDYYYDGSASGGRVSSGGSTYTPPSYNAPSRSSADYYSAPRQNSRGSYTPPSDNSGSRYSAPQQSRTYEAPSYSRPSYEAPRSNTYSQPSQPSYSAPSSGGSRGGGGSSGGGGYSGGGGGGSRGPR